MRLTKKENKESSTLNWTSLVMEIIRELKFIKNALFRFRKMTV